MNQAEQSGKNNGNLYGSQKSQRGEVAMGEKVPFKSEDHRNLFLTAMRQIGRLDNQTIDAEYSSAVYLLTADSSIWQRAQAHVSNSGITFKQMLKSDHFSSTEEALVKLAANLFGAGISADPVTLCHTSNFEVMLSALKLRHERMSLSDFED